MKLVDLESTARGIIIDLRYSSPRNVTGAALYETGAKARLDKTAAIALAEVAGRLNKQGLRIVVWDAFRPEYAQVKLRAFNSNPHFVAIDSNHVKGFAVDVTLATISGEYLDMGTDHDEFTSRAHTMSQDISPEQKKNRQTLKSVMERSGFKQWPYEWWHFDYDGK